MALVVSCLVQGAYTFSTYGQMDTCPEKKVIYWFDLIFQNNVRREGIVVQSIPCSATCRRLKYILYEYGTSELLFRMHYLEK